MTIRIAESVDVGQSAVIGPAVVLTNDLRPCAINPNGPLKSDSDWEKVGVTVSTHTSIGARSVCVMSLTIGAWATVAAGSTVICDVPPYAFVGTVPARQIGWVGRSGDRLDQYAKGLWRCPATGETSTESAEGLILDSKDDTNA